MRPKYRKSVKLRLCLVNLLQSVSAAKNRSLTKQEEPEAHFAIFIAPQTLISILSFLLFGIGKNRDMCHSCVNEDRGQEVGFIFITTFSLHILAMALFKDRYERRSSQTLLGLTRFIETLATHVSPNKSIIKIISILIMSYKYQYFLHIYIFDQS